MKVSVGIVVFTLAGVSFLAMMHVKNSVQDLHQERVKLLTRRDEQEESLRVLKAERSYLVRPAQLEAYATALGLKPIQPEQQATFPPELARALLPHANPQQEAR